MGIADNIKSIREKYGITQGELGEIAGVTDKAVSAWEQGTAEPRMSAIKKISNHFNIPNSNIIDDDIPGKRIKEMRLAVNMTLLDVAKKIGVSEGTVQRYESGNIKNLKYETVVKLASIFDCSPAYLMGWENERNEYENLDTEARILLDAKKSLTQEELDFVISLIKLFKAKDGK